MISTFLHFDGFGYFLFVGNLLSEYDVLWCWYV